MKNLVLSLFAIMLSVNAQAISDKQFTLKEVEDYMSSLKSFSADFEQIVPGEEFSKGKLYIKKPGKFLWKYKVPTPVKIVSNGGLVYFVDEETDQVTQVPNTGILFSILSKEDVSFNTKYLKLQNLTQTNRRVNLDLVATVDDNEVPVTLIFRKTGGSNLSLMKIISQNQLDQMVVVSLFGHDSNATINNDIFKVDIEDEF